ncbi:MAG TPA: c-type cytochrome domain-containing protein [Planctomycetaceae bacterium]|nr:c-type cytochrome domain-containing protein [Planctomycetaceae bacterium]
MRCSSARLGLGLVVVLGLAGTFVWAAPLTPPQKKELADITSDVGKVRSLITRKKTEEAQQALDDAEARLKKLIEEAMLANDDRQLIAVHKQIEIQKGLLAKATGKGAAPAVSFAKDVAPILANKCDNCHDATRASGGLRMESYATLEAGGRNGPVLVPGNPGASLIVQRITAANPMARMPRNAEALSQEEVRTIAAWIAAGAPFDGTEKTVSLALLTVNPDLAKEKVVIAKATGNEKVSFVRDIAPTFVNTCGGCHNDNQRRGGLSLATFEKAMAGGQSGRVIVPEKPNESRLWRLVNADDTPVMPQGNMTGITRKFHADLRTWITEGAKFDGNDAKKPLRDLIPSPADLIAEKLAKLSPEQWIEKRRTDSKELWRRTFPQGGEPSIGETEDFVVMGDVSQRRLEQVGGFAQEHAAALRTMFNVKDTPLFKGKLAVFVFKDRFGYEEFNSSIHRRQVPREVLGHSDVTTAQDQAFAAVEDIGDETSTTSPGLELNVIEHVTGAFLKRDGSNLPDWLTRGTGLAIAAAKSGAGNPYIGELRGAAGEALRKSNINNPADVFNDGQFSPADVGPIGYVLVEFLLKQGGAGPFGQLVRRFQAGDNAPEAIRTAYRTDARQLATAFATSAGSAGPARPKKKN